MSETKASKKAAKRVAREKEQLDDAIEEVTEVTEVEDAEAKAARKAAKKAAKRAARALAEQSVAADVAEDEVPNSKRKRLNDGSSAAAGLARVNYVLHPDTAAMTPEAAAAHRQSLEVALYPPEVGEQYLPMTAFNQLAPSLGSLCGDVTSYIRQKNFKIPSPIQVIVGVLLSCVGTLCNLFAL